MKLRWSLWFAATLLMAAYVVAGYLASRTDAVSIKLEPGASTQVRIFRLAPQALRMQLVFQGDHRKRPELGEWMSVAKGNVLEFPKPGAAIRLTASTPGMAPVVFEAMPKGSHSSDRIGRDLTSSLSIGPGIWRWPPPADRPRILLHAGVTPVTLNVSWLWFWFLWPFMAAIQLLWAAALILLARRKR